MTPLAGLPIPDLTPVLPALIFGILSAVAVISAVYAAFARRIVHAAFGLMAAFAGVAGLYALLGNDFLMLSQIIVYVGGILILLVFGVLLTGRAKAQLGLEKPSSPVPGILAGAALLAGLLACILSSDFGMRGKLEEPAARTTVGSIGRALLAEDGYLYPFEFVSVFLLMALVGAAYLVRRKRGAA